MSLVRYNPGFAKTLDRFFNDDLNTFVGRDFTHHVPAVNIKENDESFGIELAAPGLNKEDFKVNVENNVLTISAEKKEEKTDKYNRREFAYSSFKRAFRLPKLVDGEKIKAEYKDGVLNISLPKKEEAKPKNIEIDIV
ncbi:MAG: Hsp20/alpha crystallin family protein [Bacteroidota bacterium]